MPLLPPPAPEASATQLPDRSPPQLLLVTPALLRSRSSGLQSPGPLTTLCCDLVFWLYSPALAPHLAITL